MWRRVCGGGTWRWACEGGYVEEGMWRGICGGEYVEVVERVV